MTGLSAASNTFVSTGPVKPAPTSVAQTSGPSAATPAGATPVTPGTAIPLKTAGPFGEALSAAYPAKAIVADTKNTSAQAVAPGMPVSGSSLNAPERLAPARPPVAAGTNATLYDALSSTTDPQAAGLNAAGHHRSAGNPAPGADKTKAKPVTTQPALVNGAPTVASTPPPVGSLPAPSPAETAPSNAAQCIAPQIMASTPAAAIQPAALPTIDRVDVPGRAPARTASRGSNLCLSSLPAPAATAIGIPAATNAVPATISYPGSAIPAGTATTPVASQGAPVPVTTQASVTGQSNPSTGTIMPRDHAGNPVATSASKVTAPHLPSVLAAGSSFGGAPTIGAVAGFPSDGAPPPLLGAPTPAAAWHPATQQIASAMVGVGTLTADTGGTRLLIAMTPPAIGMVSIQIDRATDGTSAIAIAATHPTTLAALQNDHAGLDQMLTLAGLPTDHRNVTFHLDPPRVDGGGNGGSASSQAGTNQGGGSSGHGAERQSDGHQAQGSTQAYDRRGQTASHAPETPAIAASIPPSTIQMRRFGVNMMA